MSQAELATGPPPELRFKRQIRPSSAMRELSGAREMIRTLAERDLRVRYKQAVLGFAWAVILPVILMIVFSVFVKRVIRIELPQGVPYPLFTYVGLLPWAFFSSAISSGGMSLVSNNSLLNKVYCPREVFPLSSVLVAGFDTAISTAILGFLFIAFGFAPKITTLWIPVLLLVQIAFTLGLALIVSATIVYFRDLRSLLPLVLQFGLFATPVAYPVRLDPVFEMIYAALNPLVPVIEGYRRTVLFGQPPEWDVLAVGACSAVLILFGGYMLFKKLETGFADVA